MSAVLFGYFIILSFYFPLWTVIEVASGEYGDVTNHLVKSWKIQEKKFELAEMENQMNAPEGTCDTSFVRPVVVTYVPGKCTSITSSTDSIFEVVSQTTQVFLNSLNFSISFLQSLIRWRVSRFLFKIQVKTMFCMQR